MKNNQLGGERIAALVQAVRQEGYPVWQMQEKYGAELSGRTLKELKQARAEYLTTTAPAPVQRRGVYVVGDEKSCARAFGCHFARVVARAFDEYRGGNQNDPIFYAGKTMAKAYKEYDGQPLVVFEQPADRLLTGMKGAFEKIFDPWTHAASRKPKPLEALNALNIVIGEMDPEVFADKVMPGTWQEYGRWFSRRIPYIVRCDREGLEIFKVVAGPSSVMDPFVRRSFEEMYLSVGRIGADKGTNQMLEEGAAGLVRLLMAEPSNW